MEFAPLLAVVASAFFAVVLVGVIEALRWTEPDGFAHGMLFGMILPGIPTLLFLLVVQGSLAWLLTSRGRRAWWRFLIVLCPTAVIVALSLQSIVGLYPPEKRARRELPHFLGGPVPPSATDLSIRFTGGMDPSWSFGFKVSPEDYDAIRHYRAYGAAQSDSAGMAWLQFPADGHPAPNDATVYYLGYDAGKSRCVLTTTNH